MAYLHDTLSSTWLVGNSRAIPCRAEGCEDRGIWCYAPTTGERYYYCTAHLPEEAGTHDE